MISERLRLAFAVTLSADQRYHLAAVVQNVAYPAAWSLSLQALPVFLVEFFPAGGFSAELALLALPALDSVFVLWDHAAGNGSSAGADPAAALPVGDTDPLNIAAGRQAAGQAVARNGDPIYPSHFYVVPNRAPNDSPSVAVHLSATRRSTREADGNSARGFAG